ncbi:MAG: hypothetical protein HQ534_12795 [Armatimonadetes bacterium]|nr:hypothetical protein [Armatimonadota bacterium]
MNRFLIFFLRYITWFLVFFIVIRFSRFIIVYGIRFWFISIPFLVILYIYFRRRKRKFSSSKLDPKKEVPIEAEFTVIDEDEEEK